MRYKLKTLFDITETKKHRDADSTLILQQANYDTIQQVISLRANHTPLTWYVEDEDANEFGSAYKGKHKVWTFEFEIEYGQPTVEVLLNDFNFSPMIGGLLETAKINKCIIDSFDKKLKNIIITEIGT